jgi:hypothetical protein
MYVHIYMCIYTVYTHIVKVDSCGNFVFQYSNTNILTTDSKAAYGYGCGCGYSCSCGQLIYAQRYYTRAMSPSQQTRTQTQTQDDTRAMSPSQHT